MRVKRKCLVCGEMYWAIKANAKYCGISCQKQAHAEIKKLWAQKQKELFERRLTNGV